MKQLVLSLLLICSTTLVSAQITLKVPKNTKTLLVTKRGEKLWGLAEIDQRSSVVKMVSGSKFRFVLFENIYQLKIFTEDDILLQSFQYYDLPNRPGKGKLLEQLVVGEVHLLRKRRVKHFYARAYNGTNVLNKRLTEGDYFLKTEGSFQRVKRFKKQVLALCSDEVEREKLREYAKEENLQFFQPFDQIKIIQHLNELKTMKTPVVGAK